MVLIKFIVLFGLILLENLTTSVKLYFIKDLNPNYQRQPNYKISKPIAPLKELIEHIASRTKGKQYNLPHDKYDCMPGKICITRLSHKEDNIVINDALRNNFNDIAEDTSNSASKEYVDYSDDDIFNDLTRLQSALKAKKETPEHRRNNNDVSDYVNVDDLLRTVKKTVAFNDFNRNPKGKDGITAKKYDVKRHGRRFSKSRRANSEDNSEESSNSVSNEGKSKRQDALTRGVPKRFAVVDSGQKTKTKKKYYSSSGEKSQESEEVPTPKPKRKAPKKEKKRKQKKVEKLEKERERKEMYMQAPGRSIKVGKWFSDEEDDNEFRRRLPYFLPKRYYWHEKDFKNLGTFWFNGPQGRYPGIYKIGY